MRHHRPRDERGNVLIFTTLSLAFLLAMGGFAIDLAYQFSARGELQRSMDAAALAGAGKLGFDSSVFPTARQFARDYAVKNPYHNPAGGSVTLSLNEGNDPGGDIVLGTWDGSAFIPSLDGSMVNAVLCRSNATIPTSFLGILGLGTLPVSAYAIAITNPPENAPPGPIFPIGVTQCVFLNAGAFSSQGCGAAITLVPDVGTAPVPNSAAWVNLTGTHTPSAPTTNDAIACAVTGGSCADAYRPLHIGSTIGANNGMQQSVFEKLEQNFKDQFSVSPTYDVKKTLPGGDTQDMYKGPGWRVIVPVIETACPPGAISGEVKIVGWSQMVITQVINKGDCAVGNPADSASAPLCPPPIGTAVPDPNLRAVFGYYDCGKLDGDPTISPSPLAALAEHVRLVKP